MGEVAFKPGYWKSECPSCDTLSTQPPGRQCPCCYEAALIKINDHGYLQLEVTRAEEELARQTMRLKRDLAESEKLRKRCVDREEVIGQIYQHVVNAWNELTLFEERGEIRSRDPLHYDLAGWWFWDETWASRHGPYESKVEAMMRLRQYAAALQHGAETGEEDRPARKHLSPPDPDEGDEFDREAWAALGELQEKLEREGDD